MIECNQLRDRAKDRELTKRQKSKNKEETKERDREKIPTTTLYGKHT